MEYNDDKQSDQRLVERVLRGDTAAFRSVIDRTQGMVTQIVFKMVANAEDRRDIAQDVYLKVFHKLGSFKFQSKLSTWVWQITFNTCTNYLQKRKLTVIDLSNLQNEANDWRPEFADQSDIYESDLEKQLMNADLSRILENEINKLPPLYKILITLYHHEEMSYHEIGRIVELPEGTVKSYLFRARKTLKDQLSIAYKNGTL
ncbi:sigma-70 family RNA polymerase sigma factor [Dyadobacter sp. CY261]|uniref:RNA polymerase sigma factor n=1 Tax=Dyadobacter sp. CY261 TaxID=2907203 RepID=UPI001F39DE01|nr:sigma-70 family RNA polymerase sigma factor [Dyadobacter sp. CY261]MCF0072741.1 sigma-70 family RNA polymerase sigma factor [Dyadobacter sp. CY261]